MLAWKPYPSPPHPCVCPKLDYNLEWYRTPASTLFSLIPLSESTIKSNFITRVMTSVQNNIYRTSTRNFFFSKKKKRTSQPTSQYIRCKSTIITIKRIEARNSVMAYSKCALKIRIVDSIFSKRQHNNKCYQNNPKQHINLLY